MAIFLFKIIDSARDSFYVRGVGADLSTAKADAVAKWEAWSSTNTPDAMTLEQRALGEGSEVQLVASDDQEFSSTPWASYVE